MKSEFQILPRNAFFRFSIQTEKKQGDWLVEILQKIAVSNKKIFTFQEIKSDYESHDLEDFELFWFSKSVNTLREFGLLAF